MNNRQFYLNALLGAAEFYSKPFMYTYSADFSDKRILSINNLYLFDFPFCTFLFFLAFPQK
jgi:hypothetical protein